VRQKAVALGVEGDNWLRSLPDVLADLESEWNVLVGQPLPGGSEAYVAAATTHDGSEAVIKLEIPSDPSLPMETRFATTSWILSAGHGRAYAHLIRSDESRRALLLERLGPSLRTSGLGVPAQIEVLCGMLREAWKVAACVPLESGADKARRLAEFITTTWAELGQPCSERVVELALAFADARAAAFDPERSVVVHGDAHASNALRALGEESAEPRRFKFVDPECFLVEPSYDLGISMRDWTDELLAGDAARVGRERCDLLARLSGVAPQPIWEWGFIERVSTGLLVLKVGAETIGRDMLAVADQWSPTGSSVGG
jgi:streptomycin 6-kinase